MNPIHGSLGVGAVKIFDVRSMPFGSVVTVRPNLEPEVPAMLVETSSTLCAVDNPDAAVWSEWIDSTVDEETSATLGKYVAMRITGFGDYWIEPVTNDAIKIADTLTVGGAATVGGALSSGGSVTASGGLVLPTVDPAVAGVWYDAAGTLTKSTGPGE